MTPTQIRRQERILCAEIARKHGYPWAAIQLLDDATREREGFDLIPRRPSDTESSGRDDAAIDGGAMAGDSDSKHHDPGDATATRRLQPPEPVAGDHDSLAVSDDAAPASAEDAGALQGASGLNFVAEQSATYAARQSAGSDSPEATGDDVALQGVQSFQRGVPAAPCKTQSEASQAGQILEGGGGRCSLPYAGVPWPTGSAATHLIALTDDEDRASTLAYERGGGSRYGAYAACVTVSTPLKREIARLEAQYTTVVRELQALTPRIIDPNIDLQRRLAEAVEALRPFADEFGFVLDAPVPMSDDFMLIADHGLTAGMIRRASRIVAESKP